MRILTKFPFIYFRPISTRDSMSDFPQGNGEDCYDMGGECDNKKSCKRSSE